MDEGMFKLRIATIVILLGVLATNVMVVCSNDRLETKFTGLRKAIEAGDFSSGGGGGGSRTNGAGQPQATRPGDPSDIVVTGWGGKKANVLHVEGAVPNAPLRLQDKPRPQGDWYVSNNQSPPSTLNYYASSEGLAARISRSSLDRLIEVDPDRPPNIVPSLAIKWDISDDKLTYTYHLRRGVQFADGRPFTSADVKFSFDTMRDPMVKADHMRSEFDDVESVDTADPFTVVVKYKKKFWKGLYTIGYTLRVLNKGWYEEQIPVWAKKLDIADYSVEPGKEGFGEVFNKIRIPCPGTGPYYMAGPEDFTTDFVNLVQNPFYFGMQVYPDRWNFKKLRWVFIADYIAQMEAFRKQKIDITVVAHDRWYDELHKDETMKAVAKHFIYDHIGLHASFVGWNCRRAPFNDPVVRRAMTHLINRQWILDEINRGHGTIAVCNSKRSYPTYSSDLEAKEFSIPKALELLKSVGWEDTDGDGILDKDGKPFEWVLKVPSGGTFYTRVGGLIEDACKEAGIRMTTRPIEWSTFYKDYHEKHDYDAVALFNGWNDVWIDNYDSLHSSQDRPQGGNSSGWHNDRVDELLVAMRAEFDEDKRTEMFHEVNRLFYEEQPQTLLCHGLVGVLINKRFEGIKVRPTGMQSFDFWVKPENVLYK